MTQYTFERFWQMAFDIMETAGYSNVTISDTRHGGSGGQKTEKVDWVADFRRCASEYEAKHFNRYTLTGEKVKGFDSMVYRCAKLVPAEIEHFGYVLLERDY